MGKIWKYWGAFNVEVVKFRVVASYPEGVFYRTETCFEDMAWKTAEMIMRDAEESGIGDTEVRVTVTSEETGEILTDGFIEITTNGIEYDEFYFNETGGLRYGDEPVWKL